MSVDPLGLVARLRPEWQVLEIRPLSGGFSNVSHWLRTARHGSFVLRVPRAGNPFAIDRGAEASIARWAASLGIGAAVEHVDPDSGVQICAAIDGTPLGDLPRTQWPAPEALGRLLRTLHEAPGAPAAGATVAATLRGWRQRCRSFGVRAQSVRPEPRAANLRLCHRDVNPWNVLIGSDGTMTLVDWELAGPADPRFDLANAVLLFEYDATESARFLAAASEGQVTLRELDPWLVCVREREYLWAELALAAGIDTPEIRVQRAACAPQPPAQPG